MPKWSRCFLAGDTALIPTHHNLTDLDLNLSPDARMLAANHAYLLFPLAGPGGKLGVHPMSETGRLPTHIPALTSSSKIVDFALDPFDPTRVTTLHSDAAVRVWRLPAPGQPLPEQGIDKPELTLQCKKFGKQSQLAFHPTAKDLIATCSSENEGPLILWNLAQPEEPILVPVQGEGATSLAWSLEGSFVALACRDKTVRVLSLRSPDDSETSSSSDNTGHVEAAAESFLDRTILFSSTSGKPSVTLTFAQSSDGKIAGAGKKQLALSSKESMLMTHKLRTMHDGIMVGIGTVLNDNPQLNARLLTNPPPVEALPRPIVVDSKLRTLTDCKLISNFKAGTGKQPLILCSKDVDAAKKDALQEAGAEVVQVASSSDSKLEWESVLVTLGRAGIQRLMVEGGATVIDSLMKEKHLIDNLLVTVAPQVVGEQGYGFPAAVPYPLSETRTSSDDTLVVCGEQKFGIDNVMVWRTGQVSSSGQSSDRIKAEATIKFSDLRNLRLVWLDDSHLVVAGHTMGSERQLRLFKIVSGSELALEEVGRLGLDVSPAVLFPHYDPDTNILWLWSKGERSVPALHIDLKDRNLFTALPAFQHQQPQLGLAFLNKEDVDPRRTEIAVGYRLEKGDIRRVSWSIPRLRTEYFQDDIFQRTKDVSTPLTSAERWLNGEPNQARASFMDLCPKGMEPLSQAPELKKESKYPKGPKFKEMT